MSIMTISNTPDLILLKSFKKKSFFSSDLDNELNKFLDTSNEIIFEWCIWYIYGSMSFSHSKKYKNSWYWSLNTVTGFFKKIVNFLSLFSCLLFSCRRAITKMWSINLTFRTFIKAIDKINTLLRRKRIEITKSHSLDSL